VPVIVARVRRAGDGGWHLPRIGHAVVEVDLLLCGSGHREGRHQLPCLLLAFRAAGPLLHSGHRDPFLESVSAVVTVILVKRHRRIVVRAATAVNHRGKGQSGPFATETGRRAFRTAPPSLRARRPPAAGWPPRPLRFPRRLVPARPPAGRLFPRGISAGC